jgi:hypothetical protein
MINRFMMSVAAAALIAGTGFANAQGTMGREAPPAGAPAEQHSAPATEHTGKPVAPVGRTSAEPTAPSSGMKATQSEQKPAGATNQRAEDNMQGQKPNGMRSETNDNAKGKDMKAEGNGMKPEGRDGNMNADSKGAADSKTQTTGQAGAGGKLSSDQRTKITSVIREQHIAPLAHVNFSISVGTRVPRDVEFHPLPTEIVTIYPEWRGYEFIMVGEQIIVVDPRTFEIVAVLDV